MRENTSSSIKMILLAEAQITGGTVPNLIAFKYFLEQLGILLQQERWLRCSAGMTRNQLFLNEG